MKNIVFVGLVALTVLSVIASYSYAANPVNIDVLYMDHGPLKDSLNKMKAVFSTYGNQLNVSWHDFDSQEGEQFKAKMGIKQHVPLIIWVDGKSTCAVGAKQVTFAGFPTGSGPSMFQGKWTMDDLRAALDQATEKE